MGKNKLILLMAALLAVSTLSLVSAVECGSAPTDGCEVTQDTNFTQGTYFLSSGISIGANGITLDCNGAVLNSNSTGYSGTGINVVNVDDVTIKNCTIENYDTGVRLYWQGVPCTTYSPSERVTVEYSTINSSTGIYIEGGPSICTVKDSDDLIRNNEFLAGVIDSIIIRDANKNRIENNTIRGQQEGITLGPRSHNNNVTGNIFVGNGLASVKTEISARFNNIWNNDIYSSNITYSETTNEYCIDGIGNSYFNSTDGPTCECMPLLDDLSITSNRTFCHRNYTLPSGISFGDVGVTLDCRGFEISSGESGYSGTGVDVVNVDDITIRNCSILNYNTGVRLYWQGVPCTTYNPSERAAIEYSSINSSIGVFIAGGPSTCSVKDTNNIIRNNEFLPGGYSGVEINDANKNVIQGNLMDGLTYGAGINSRSQGNNISQNDFIDNTNTGVIASLASADFNNIFNNNFIGNVVQASDVGSNDWNVSDGGNYWDDYDTAGEGCSNDNSDLFCDDPYNISGSSGSQDHLPYVVKDGWLMGLNSNIIPIQVIENVDMVKGKTTLIRVVVTFTNILGNDTITPDVSLYWNNTLIDFDNSQTISHNESVNYDFWHVPTETGNNIPIRAEINGTSGHGFNFSDISIKNVDVIETRELTLTFVRVDNAAFFEESVAKSLNFMYDVYPIKDGGINYELNSAGLQSTIFENLPFGVGVNHLNDRVYHSTLISGQLPERAVGIVPLDWFDIMFPFQDVEGAHTDGSLGVLVESESPFLNTKRQVTAHELGHSYGLCDEYSFFSWENKNNEEGCPNGDSNNDNDLDPICHPNGCPTSSLKLLSGLSDNSTLYNLMGKVTDRPWIDEVTYNSLLNEFSHESPIFTESRIVVAGTVNKTSGLVAKFDNFYRIDSGLAINNSEFQGGNYSIESLDGSNNSIYNFSFGVSFFNMFIGGNTTETNETYFAFTIPFNESTSSFVLKENGVIKDTLEISDNAPSIQIISPSEGQTFLNQNINIILNASDLDGDELGYAILFSTNNGSNYTTINFDLNSTNISISSNDLSDCKLCKIKVLATDGVNTNESISEAFEIENDLNITRFRVVYQNNTERIFKIDLQNTFTNLTLENVSWSLDTGDNIIDSQELFNLHPQEEIFLFVHYNYTNSGIYNVTFVASDGTSTETEVMEIII